MRLMILALFAMLVATSPTYSCRANETCLTQGKMPIEYDGQIFCLGEVGDKATKGNTTIETLKDGMYKVTSSIGDKILKAFAKYKCPGLDTPRYLKETDPND